MGKKADIEANECEPEMPATEPFAHHPTGDLGKPEISCAEQREYRSADQHVVKMCDNEVSVVNLKVKRHRG